jgi:hypothetical protein
MGATNRLFVMPTDSHITEERRIEEAMEDLAREIAMHNKSLQAEICNQDWHAVAATGRELHAASYHMWSLDQRLQDVKQIIEQFGRINEHMYRIENTEEDIT